MAHDAHLLTLAGAFVLVMLTLNLWFAYVLGVYRQRRRRKVWSCSRLVSFTFGCVLLVFALSPPMLEWGHADLRGHMSQHLLLGMFAPIALMLGAPGTLLLRSVPATTARRIMEIASTLPVRCLTHPIAALLLDIGALYLLYLTPLYRLSFSEPLLHLWLHVHFVLAGYLFSWSIAGPDPAPYRPDMRVRLAVLFVATAAHAVLGKLMYAYGFPRNAGHDLAEIEVAAQLMYYGGDFAELLLAIVFFAAWYRRGGRQRLSIGNEAQYPASADGHPNGSCATACRDS
ncbi:cytochrome c oxidase assembly protein [Pseudomonas sp. IC_126]|uniref:cytochrome c oxidase assembly protein n=1 Tax=Pseudomonas sp. IC_126 TaxID=2547400 RepID=UPI00103A8EA2|nr:cytochrome c oxidase assembly protein [Pseudomonas sp. IC_126]TCD22487.1 cytochrome c oxidase assembly protein [Pseudomonas sp. IC_126]